MCYKEGDDDELYKPPYIHMPGYGGHWEFYNDRGHAEGYFAEKHPHIAQLRQKLYDREVNRHFIYILNVLEQWPNIGKVVEYSSPQS